jgi:hypothetical protein
MTILQALAILEAAVLECKHRNNDTPEMRAALAFLEPLIQPAWLIPHTASTPSTHLPPGSYHYFDDDFSLYPLAFMQSSKTCFLLS